MSVIKTWQYSKGLYAGMGVFGIALGITRLMLPHSNVPTYGFIIIGVFFLIYSYIFIEEDVM